MRISDWSSDVCSSDLRAIGVPIGAVRVEIVGLRLELLPDVIALALHRLAIFARDAGEVVEAIVDGDHDRVAVVEVAGRAGPKRLVAIRIGDRRGAPVAEIGRAAHRARECKYVYISVVAGSYNKKKAY